MVEVVGVVIVVVAIELSKWWWLQWKRGWLS